MVAIHSQDLADAINNIELDQELYKYPLTADQQYLCKTMHPLLPVVARRRTSYLRS
jgi:hypothetical protein